MDSSYHLLNASFLQGEAETNFLIAGDGVYGSVRCFGMSFPVPLVLCDIRGLLPLSGVLFSGEGVPSPSDMQAPAPFGPSYHVLTQPELPALDRSRMYQYVIAREGVFLLAGLPGLEVLMPISVPCILPGLASVQPFVTWKLPRVGETTVLELFERARSTREQERGQLIERLYYLTLQGGEWSIREPEQKTTGVSVQVTSTSEEDEMAYIEGHSHHEMRAYFSRKDNHDEIVHGGFKVYFVLGGVQSNPHIRTRICVHGYAWNVPATLFFELPTAIEDGGAKP